MTFLAQAVFLWTCLQDPAGEALLRSQQLIERGDLAGARKELTAAMERFPSEPGVYNLLGVVEVQTGAIDAAEHAFQKAVQLAPRFTGAYLNLGRLYQEHPDRSNAAQRGIDVYRSILAYDPGHAEANYQAAILLLHQRSHRASVAHLDRLPPEAQGRAQVLALRCAAYAGMADGKRAAEVGGRLAAAPDLTEPDVVQILPVLDSSDGLDIAVGLLEALSRRGLASTDSIRRLGLLQERKTNYPQARQALERAAQSGPSVPVLLDLARVAYKQQDREGALGYLAHARDLDPKNAGVHFFFGIVCIELEVPFDAQDSLRKAVELDPGNAWYHYALGAVLVQTSDPNEAVPHLRRFVELKSGEPHGRFALAYAYFSTGQAELARNEFESIVQAPETAAGAHYFLGRIALEDGNDAQALAELEKAIAADAEYADAYAELGLYHLQQGDLDVAERQLRRALELDPDGLRANFNLLRLYQRQGDPRAPEQQARFEDVKKKRQEKQIYLLRRVVVKPY
jgi:tetratricopeptide (TPR) repeat protein